MCPLWFHTNSFSYADAVKLLLKLCLPLPVTLTAHTHVHAHAPTYTYMLHKHLHICASKYSKYLPIYIFSAGFQRPCRCFTVQHLCICMCVHMYHFQNSFSPSHFPSISSFPLKCIPSMATFSFVLSLSMCQPSSLSPPSILLPFSISSKSSAISINGKAIFHVCQHQRICSLLWKVLLCTPQSTDGTKEMFVMWPRWVSPLTDRLSLNIYQGNLALYAWKEGPSFVVHMWSLSHSSWSPGNLDLCRSAHVLFVVAKLD